MRTIFAIDCTLRRSIGMDGTPATSAASFATRGMFDNDRRSREPEALCCGQVGRTVLPDR
jgi:hypothetical protein